MNEERIYQFWRKLLFWLLLILFLVSLPMVIIYSLGYQFNRKARSFQKIGVISFKSEPQEAKIFVDGKDIGKTTPFDLKEVAIGTYKIKLEKEGFYPYEKKIEVKGGLVTFVDAVLLPKIKGIEKIKLEIKPLKFFIIGHLFTKKIVVFTKETIYILNENFEEISHINLDNFITEEDLNSILELKEGKNCFIFFNPYNIWFVDYSNGVFNKKEENIECIYRTSEEIKDVFFAIKENYLVIHLKSKIVILNIKNTDILYDIYNLNDQNAQVYYDSSQDSIFIKDRIYANSKDQILFRIELTKRIYEK